jgi:hypothetical protein
MANFDAQVKSLTGIDISNSTIQGYLTQWLTDGAREVTNVMPQDILEEHATKTEIGATGGTVYLEMMVVNLEFAEKFLHLIIVDLVIVLK